ncbi:MAG: hypothetical protein HC805_07305 [Alkalinema sp. RL_2_19]|nr:hypothetical protein [Alkalinema sp. RL_2_19]
MTEALCLYINTFYSDYSFTLAGVTDGITSSDRMISLKFEMGLSGAGLKAAGGEMAKYG